LQNTLNTFGATIAQRIGLPELRLTRTPDIQTRLDTFTDALKNEDIRKLATEVLKIDPARAGEAISAIADEKVNEAVEKLTTDAAKDLKEARTLKKKNTELAQRVEDLTKKLTELSNQVTKLKEGTK
jgi:predicted  nucleic acid-binding Zn-ribbon protein